MNCSEVRELFSARADNELPKDLHSRLDAHLIRCSTCQREWLRFRSVISALRGLPEEQSSPAFVGQVLDRVRAYEAEGARSLAPLDRSGSRPGSAWIATLREWFGGGLMRPAAALAVGCLAVGVAAGSWVNHLAKQDDAASGPTVAIAQEEPSIQISGASLEPSPFEDLTDEIRTRDAEAPGARPDLYSPNWGGAGLQQQVRFENDAPRIIF